MQPNQQNNQYRAPQPGQQLQPNQQVYQQQMAQREQIYQQQLAQREQQHMQQQQHQQQHRELNPQMVAMQQAYMNPKFSHNQQQHELTQRLMQVEKHQQSLNSMAMAQQQQNMDESLRLQMAAMQMKGNPEIQKAYMQAFQQQQQLPCMYNNSNPPPGFSTINQSAEMMYGRGSALSAEAPEFVPGGAPSAVTFKNPAEAAGQGSDMISLLAIQPELSSHPVLIQVDNAVVQLTTDPNKYEATSRSLTQLLSTQVKEQALMKEIVTLIFEQGVGEVNFRYPGGRLCEHLSKNIHQQYEGLSFKSLLLKSCQEEFDYRFLYQEQKSYNRLIGFTSFLADIMVRLLLPSGQPIEKLKEALCMMLTMLLDICSNESLKCAAQVLKMSGRFLDMGDNAAFSTVMNHLRDTTVSAIPPSMKTMLLSVVELRASKWGANIVPPPAVNQPADERNPPANVLGTVYYNTDGAIDRIEEDYAEANGCSDNDDAKQFAQAPAATAQVCELVGEEAQAFTEFLHSLT